MGNPFLSLIIPAFNEEHRLPSTLEQVVNFSQNQAYEVEILVIENGSQDRTYAIAQEYALHHPIVRVLQEKERGKGLAVKRGMLAATGEFRFMADADFSMPITEINRFLPPALTSFDIAIASREATGSVRYNEPPYRHLVGRVFNTMIRLLALPGLEDTQCGFKCWRAPVAEAIFPCLTVQGWSFDVEVLYIARQHGYKIIEVPIPWYFNSDSKVRVVPDSFKMALDLLRIRKNGYYHRYNHPDGSGK